MKPVHVVLIMVAASFAGIIALADVLFVGFKGSGVTGRTGSSLLVMKAEVCATTQLAKAQGLMTLAVTTLPTKQASP